MKKVYLGLIGFGHIGSGLVRLLKDRHAFLKEKLQLDLVLKKICDKDLSGRRIVKVKRNLLTQDINDILNDPQIQIVIELIGGVHPAKEIILRALQEGKDVVTANKALLAEGMDEILKAAKRHKKNICFEASVGGGIPVIKSLREGLVANRINAIYGIVNGTSNFILTKMQEDNLSFKDALKEAQAKGYAEKKPTLDIEGIDSAHKLIVLVYLAFGRFVKIEDIFIEGISDISLADIRYVEQLGLKVKLLAIAKKEAGELEVRVHPTLIPKNHLLASVSGVYNAIYIEGDLVGDLLFFGRGAGQNPTASAVVSDIADLASAQDKVSKFSITAPKAVKLRKINQIKSRYYIRIMAADKPGVLSKISGILASRKISIASVTQKERGRTRIVPVVMVTHEANESQLRQALEKIDKLSEIRPRSVAIRMEEL